MVWDYACKFWRCRQAELENKLIFIKLLIIYLYYCFCWILPVKEINYSGHIVVTWHYIFLSIYSDTCSPPPVDFTLCIITSSNAIVEPWHVWAEKKNSGDRGFFFTKLRVYFVFHFSVSAFLYFRTLWHTPLCGTLPQTYGFQLSQIYGIFLNKQTSQVSSTHLLTIHNWYCTTHLLPEAGKSYSCLLIKEFINV